MGTMKKKRGPKKGWKNRIAIDRITFTPSEKKGEVLAELNLAPLPPKPLDQILDDLESYFTNSINEARERVKEIRSRLDKL